MTPFLVKPTRPWVAALVLALALLPGISAEPAVAVSGTLDFTISGGTHHQVGDSITIQPTGSFSFAPDAGNDQCAYTLALGSGSFAAINEVVPPAGDTCPAWTFTMPNLADMDYWPEGSSTSMAVVMSVIGTDCSETCLALSSGTVITYDPSSESVVPASNLPVVFWTLDHNPLSNGEQGTLTVTEAGFGDLPQVCTATIGGTNLYTDEPACSDINFTMANDSVDAGFIDSFTPEGADPYSAMTSSGIEILSASAISWNPPGAPTGVSAVGGDGQATVSWSAPSDGSGYVATYTVTSTPDGQMCTSPGVPLSCTVTGLTNGQSYTFTVVASNDFGDGPASDPSNSVTPVADTTPPSVSSPDGHFVSPATLGRKASFELTWPAASDDSGIDHYDLQFKKGSHPWRTVSLSSPTATGATLGLVPGAYYRFRLRATDTAANTSAWDKTARTRLRRPQEKAPAISYTGGWRRVALSGASGGYVKKTTSAGASASYTFDGTSIALVTTTGPHYGMAEVWLDGVQQTTLDLYSASRHTQQILWAPSAPLTAGSHTLELIATGTKNVQSANTRVDLDALLVW